MDPSSQPALTRWKFIGLLAAAGVTATAGYALYPYAPWLKDDERAGPQTHHHHHCRRLETAACQFWRDGPGR